MQALAVVCQLFLVPGAFSPGTDGAARFVTSTEYFAEYRAYFEKKGCAVKMGEFPPDATIEERSLVVRDQIERLVKEKGAPVWVLAHSQGALDIRFALKTLGLKGVSAVATIGSPHRGTPLADWVVEHRERGSWLYWALRYLGSYDLRELRFAAELKESFLAKHADKFEQVPGVRYGAARAVCRTDCTRVIRLLQRWAGIPDGDGLVPASSQSFGDDLGEYDLDHLSEIGVDVSKRSERARLMNRLWEFFSRRP